MLFNIISWNVRGAASRRSIRNIKNLISLHKLHALIILEPRISGTTQADKVCRQLGFPNFFRVEAEGFSGGIWLLWNSLHVQIEIVAYLDQFIHALVSGISEFDWLLTAVYGSPDEAERRGLWQSLTEANGIHHLPWLLMGDFNQVLSADKRQSRCSVNLGNCRRMLNCFRDCNLVDLETSGPKFTWWNKRDGSNFTKAKLDRAVANELWLYLINNFTVTTLPRTNSDHHPICLKCSDASYGSPLLYFRFENAWMTHDNFMDCVKESLSKSNTALLDTLHVLAQDLKVWSTACFGDIYRRKRRVLARLNGIQKCLDQGPNDYLQQLEVLLIEELNLICFQEETMLKQKSRMEWIKHGDCNSKFFHAAIKKAHTKRVVTALKLEDGTWCSEPDSLRQVVVDYYRELYSENDLSPSYHRLPALCSSWKLDPAEKLSLQEDISKE